MSEELEKQKELLRQHQKNYVICNNKLENKFFSIVLKIFQELYLGSLFQRNFFSK